MSLEIVEKRKNPLLKREEADLVFDHKGKATPSRQELISGISKKLDLKEDLIIINRIITPKGNNESNIDVFLYSKKEDIPKSLLEASKKRMKEKKAEEKPAENKKEEPAKEEPEHEKKEEAPKHEEKKEHKGHEHKEGHKEHGEKKEAKD